MILQIIRKHIQYYQLKQRLQLVKSDVRTATTEIQPIGLKRPDTHFSANGKQSAALKRINDNYFFRLSFSTFYCPDFYKPLWQEVSIFFCFLMVQHINFFQQVTSLGVSVKRRLACRVRGLKNMLKFLGSKPGSRSERQLQSNTYQSSTPGHTSPYLSPEQQKFLQSSIEHSQEITVIADPDFRCVAINKLGRKKSQAILGARILPGVNIQEKVFSKHEGLQEVKESWEKALQGKSVSSEVHFEGVDARPSYYRIHLHPVYDDAGNVVAAVQTVQEITARKEAIEGQQKLHDALLLTNSKLQGIIKGTSYAIVSVDAQLKIEQINEQAKRMLKYFCHSEPEPGDTFPDIVHDKKLLESWQRALKGEAFTRLHKRPHARGISHYELSFNSIHNEAGLLIGASLIARDVSKERETEQELKDIREFRFLAENMAQLIWITRANGEPEYYNERFFRYTGTNLDQLQHDQWRNLIHHEDLEEAIQIWDRALQTGVACEMEYRLKRAADQSYRWHLVRSIPMKNENGDVTHWVGSATDIHDRHLQTEEIAEQNRQLSRINKYMDDFVHSTAHDMRVPVARLQLLIDAFQELPNHERESLLPKISRSVEHLDSTLRGLVQVIELQGTDEVAEEHISLRKVVDDILGRHQEAILEAGAQIHIHDDEECEICYVKSYIYTIINNLVSNALKYRHSERQLQLSISIKKKDGYCLITVEDNGQGIDLSRYRKQMFKPFRKAHSRTDGLGLGLYVAHTMLEKNGGYIEVESKPNDGTSFQIYLKEYTLNP